MSDVWVLATLGLLQGTLISLSIAVPATIAMRAGRHDVEALAIGLAVSAFAGWLTFIAYWIDPVVGNWFRRLVLLAMLGAGGWLAIRIWRSEQQLFFRLAPCLLPLVAGFGLVLWAFAGHDLTDVLAVAAVRFSHQLPGDNLISLLFAKGLASGDVPSPLFAGWLSSDRPPLQVGMFLLYRLPLPTGLGLVYQVSSTVMMMYALTGAYLLTLALRFDRLMAWTAAFLLALSPLVIVNATFVWPKLLAAALLCAPAAIMFSPRYGALRAEPWAGVLAGVSAAMAMGAHGTSAYVLLAFSVAAIMLSRIPSVRFTLAGLATFVGVYAPWVLYQRFADPPGNRLLKWHLAGVAEIDGRGFVETLSGSYRALTFSEWLDGRVANVVQIVRSPVMHIREVFSLPFRSDAESAAAVLRGEEFFVWSYGFGVLTLLVVLLPLALFFRLSRPPALVVTLSLAIWALLALEPGQTTTHQGSYFPQIAVFALAAALAGHSRIGVRCAVVACALQAVAALLVYGVY